METDNEKSTVRKLVDVLLRDRRIQLYQTINRLMGEAISHGTLGSSRTVLVIRQTMADELRNVAAECFAIVCRVYESSLSRGDPDVSVEMRDALRSAIAVVRERIDIIYNEMAGPIAAGLMNKQLIGPLSLDEEYRNCLDRYEAELRVIVDAKAPAKAKADFGSMFLLRPNFFGVGVDLAEMWRRFGGRLKEKSNHWLQRIARFVRRR